MTDKKRLAEDNIRLLEENQTLRRAVGELYQALEDHVVGHTFDTNNGSSFVECLACGAAQHDLGVEHKPDCVLARWEEYAE